MLDKLPHAVGHALEGTRAGLDAITLNHVEAPATITLTSPAFAPDEVLPTRFTADGTGISPPLRWTGVPAAAKALVILVEDADSPTPQPLVHAIVHGLPAADTGIEEGALPGPAGGGTTEVGRNSFLHAGWLPPDPPPGHGPHRYVFQVYALDVTPELGSSPGRSALVSAMAGHVLAKGGLIGIFGRS